MLGHSLNRNGAMSINERKKKLLLGLSFSTFGSSSSLVKGKSLRRANVLAKLKVGTKSLCLTKYVAKKVYVKWRYISTQF